ncbi:hypothetical protein RIF29_08403 [Crotalaria pallida]|uniref:Uncharacterized protein n=1 Tax=Crotalaria pallida TaxID=3830 RepID=A0AAN9FTD5_CROPI
MELERDRKVELIDLAVQKLIQDNRRNNNMSEEEEEGIFDFLKTDKKEEEDDEAEYQRALSQLLSASQQLEIVKGDEVLKQSKASTPSVLPAPAVQKIESDEKVDAAGEVDSKCNGSETTDEIVKELKKVKRQNFVTHCLLSVMIVVTVAWQLSEVSLIMKVKDGINHPFRSFGSMLKGMVKVPNMNGEEGDNKEQQSESPTLPNMNGEEGD